MNQLSYSDKEVIMDAIFGSHKSPAGFRSVYKSVPAGNYELIKQFIDFTKYFVMFRGPRPHRGYSTRKADAHSFDVYERDAFYVNRIRLEREAFQRGVEYGRKLNGN